MRKLTSRLFAALALLALEFALLESWAQRNPYVQPPPGSVEDFVINLTAGRWAP